MELTEKQLARFWAKVDKTDTCWLWTGACDKGYGICRINKINYKVHRVSWFLTDNTIPENHIIRHKCLAKNCLNPAHLETGTEAENGRDKIRDGTSIRGIKHPNCKLTEQQVRDIKSSTKSNKELSEYYNVSRTTISSIIHSGSWYWLV